MMTKRPVLLSIQYLRAVAAAAVVLAHSGWFDPLLGQQGVDIFFVISGFVMMLVTRRETRPRNFIAARIQRIVPLYWLLTLLWWATHPDLSLRHVALSLALIPHMGPEQTIWPVMTQGWTLLFEAFFYALFAIALLAPAKARLPILTGVLLCLAITGLLTRSDDALSQVYTSPTVLEFAAGAWLHQAWQRGFLARAWAGPVALVAATVGFAFAWRIEFGLWRFLGWGLPALLLVAGSLSIERSLPRVSILMLLGNASYAIYLTHWFVIPWLRNALHYWPSIAPGGILLGTLAAGCAVHLIVERPLSFGVRRLSNAAIARRPDPVRA